MTKTLFLGLAAISWLASCGGKNLVVGSNDGGSSSSGSGGSGGGSSSGSSTPDASSVNDAEASSTGDMPPGLARFAFVVNGVVQTPLDCASEDWQFAPFSTAAEAGCNPDPSDPSCPGVTSVHVVNTGPVSIAYYATNLWSGGYVPGVLTGAALERAGVLAPGDDVDITPVYAGGITALLGSAGAFSSPDAGKFAFDEGTIPWPPGVAGSGGATVMSIAQIDVFPSCMKAGQQW